MPPKVETATWIITRVDGGDDAEEGEQADAAPCVRSSSRRRGIGGVASCASLTGPRKWSDARAVSPPIAIGDGSDDRRRRRRRSAQSVDQHAQLARLVGPDLDDVAAAPASASADDLERRAGQAVDRERETARLAAAC